MRLAVFLLILIGFILVMGGCHATQDNTASPVLKSAPVTVQAAQVAVNHSQSSVKAADGKLAQALPLMKNNQQAYELVSSARGDLASAVASGVEALTDLGQAASAAAKDQKTIAAQTDQITKLKSADPFIAWLRRIGAGLVGIAVALTLLGVYFKNSTFLVLAIVAGIVGMVLGIVASILPTLELIVLWCSGIFVVLAFVYVSWEVWNQHHGAKSLANVMAKNPYVPDEPAGLTTAAQKILTVANNTVGAAVNYIDPAKAGLHA